MTACPICERHVGAPSFSEAVSAYGFTGHEVHVLETIWRGRGLPVQTERIFDAMYADDADGGPSQSKMYQAFKIALRSLRERLEGSGISISNVGYRRGLRLSLR